MLQEMWWKMEKQKKYEKVFKGNKKTGNKATIWKYFDALHNIYFKRLQLNSVTVLSSTGFIKEPNCEAEINKPSQKIESINETSFITRRFSLKKKEKQIWWYNEFKMAAGRENVQMVPGLPYQKRQMIFLLQERWVYMLFGCLYSYWLLSFKSLWFNYVFFVWLFVSSHTNCLRLIYLFFLSLLFTSFQYLH